MNHSERPYLSYLLRLWRAAGDGDTVWRSSLQPAVSGERRHFATLEKLFAYLKQETGALSPEEQERSERK
jgi:hypothetical protein